MTKPLASLSLDLDNKWAYLRTHGVESWAEYPSYLDTVVPRVLRACTERDLRITVFVVGEDARQAKNHDALCALAAAGHEIGNHSLNHEPWLHTLPRPRLEAEIRESEDCIESATGHRPVGFRGPGYSLSADVLEILAERKYLYDASTLPTFIGPLARWYFRRTASREAIHEAERRELFGSFREGLRSNKPYLWTTPAGPVVEIPVTTFPFLKLPIHMTYLWYLWQFSPWLARNYLRTALTACRISGVGPSILLHPLDFLGAEDEPEMTFFPGMNLPREEKLALLHDLLAHLTARYEIVPMQDYALRVWRQHGLQPPVRPPAQIFDDQLAAAVNEPV